MSGSSKIKARPGLRILFLLLALLLAVSLFWAGAAEKGRRDQWRSHQQYYKRIFLQRIGEKLSAARKAENEEESDRLTRLLNQTEATREKIKVVFLPGAQTRDFCITCHTAMENPLFENDPSPLKRHPSAILKDHPIDQFGCTLCHHGQGIGLSVEKAHGVERNWESPRLPMKFVQSSCLECHESVYALKGAETAAAGKRLFTEKGCYGCHDARVRTDLPKFSTPFNDLARKIISKPWLTGWLKDPAGIRPATLMPGFRLSERQRNDLVAFLYSMKDNSLNLPLTDNGRGSAANGKALFNEKACVACHSEKADTPGLTRRVPQLSDAGLKLDADWLVNWITDPAGVNSDTWMPRPELTTAEVRDIAAFIKSLTGETLKADLNTPVPDGDAEKGKRLSQRLGCMGCHMIRGEAAPAKVGVSVTDIADKRLAELPFGESAVPQTKWDWIYNKIDRPAVYKTKDMPMNMPDFSLDAEEVTQLTVFYLFNRLRELPEDYRVRESVTEALGEKGEWMLAHFNCRGCHSVLSDETPRIDAFLAKKSMVPPRIVDEVEKVQPAWLYNYLNRPYAMRPWLSIRMPAFNLTFEDKTTLIRYLHSLMPEDKQQKISLPYETALVKSDYDQETLDMGQYRFRSDKCMQCHPVSFSGELPEGKTLEDLSINLMLAKSRLRFLWIRDFLRNPDRYAGAGTKMPFVYYTPDKVPRITDPEDWIQRTALFMMFMDKVPPPIKAEETAREVQTFDFSNY